MTTEQIVIYREIVGRVLEILVVQGWNNDVKTHLDSALRGLKEEHVIKWYVFTGRGFKVMAQDGWDICEVWIEILKKLDLRRSGDMYTFSLPA